MMERYEKILRIARLIGLGRFQKGGRLMNKYEIIIHWSDEDQAFLADVPELPGSMAHGDTYESALANIQSVMDLWIKTAKEFNDPIPKPKGRRLAFA